MKGLGDREGGEQEDRRDLLEKVKAGELSPVRADERARQSSLGSLSNIIPPEEQWPTGRSHWSLTMVLAWIAWRSYSEVREWDGGYLAQCRRWAPRPPNPASSSGHGLCRRRPPNFEQFGKWGQRRFGPWQAGSDGRPLGGLAREPECALGDLRAASVAGEVVAVGIPKEGGRRVQIPAHEWLDLEVSVDAAGLEVFSLGQEPSVAVYTDVLWPRPAIVARWPGHPFSDLDERGDIRSSPVGAADFDALYEWTDASVMASQPPADSVRRRAWTNADLKALTTENQSRLDRGLTPFTIRETEQWAKAKGVSRDGARCLRRNLPVHLKLKNGAPGRR